MKFAVLYQRRGKWIVGAQGRTTAGVLIGIGAPLVMDATADASALGRIIRETLSRSRSPVPHPSPAEWPEVTNRFLRATGVKSWASFVRGAILTTIESDDSRIVLQPYENRGAREAFQPGALSGVSVDAKATDEEVGAAALAALERCGP